MFPRWLSLGAPTTSRSMRQFHLHHLASCTPAPSSVLQDCRVSCRSRPAEPRSAAAASSGQSITDDTVRHTPLKAVQWFPQSRHSPPLCSGCAHPVAPHRTVTTGWLPRIYNSDAICFLRSHAPRFMSFDHVLKPYIVLDAAVSITPSERLSHSRDSS